MRPDSSLRQPAPALQPVLTMPGAPLIGHALLFKRDPLAFLRATREYGDVVAIRLGPMQAYVINDAALIRRVLVTDARKFDRGAIAKKGRALFGNGLVVSDGAHHKRQRRLVQPAFHRARIAQYATTMANSVDTQLRSWRDGQQLAMDTEFRTLALSLLTRTLFSPETGASAIPEIDQLVPTVMDGLVSRALSPLPWLAKLPTPANRRLNGALTRLHGLIDGFIADYRAAGADHNDLLSMLLMARDEETGEGMTDQEIHDEVLTFMIAGAETTGSTLSWACHLLAEHPDVQTRVQEEVDEVLGGRPPGLDDLGKLQYTRQVLTETLRLYPTAFAFWRGTTEDIELGGHLIPAGSALIISPYSLHRTASLYPEPDRFDPDRWVPERSTAAQPRHAYIPFGAGGHTCIGESFAWTEMLIALSTLASRWTVRPVPGSNVQPTTTTLIQPSELPLTVHCR